MSSKLIKPEYTLVIARGWGEQSREELLKRQRNLYGAMEIFWNTELFTLKWLILCYVEFTSVIFF